MKELNILAACLQETNKNWLQTGVYNNIKKVLNKVWQRNKISTSIQGTHHHGVSTWWHSNLVDGLMDKSCMQLRKGQGWEMVLCNTQRKK
eukprot:542088-Ditylum_brightwellii.AAC.1